MNLSEEDQLKEDKETELKNERIKKGKKLKESYKKSNKVYELPENQEEIERLMLEEEFNVTQENLTIVNETSNIIIEENETSLGKRTRSSSPIIKSSKSKLLKKDNNEQIKTNNE